mmetsp:Transcript_13319/g.46490  ORF Transcript_13319/g.46490 Transcript_13319/m.46490 type:complete len:444 (-) Transcript_13319:4069-5400(-)
MEDEDGGRDGKKDRKKEKKKKDNENKSKKRKCKREVPSDDSSRGKDKRRRRSEEEASGASSRKQQKRARKFLDAVGGGYLLRVEKMLSKRKELLSSLDEKTGQTPLQLSCEHGHFQISLLLLRRCCDVNGQDAQGNTALHLAVRGRHWDLVRLLTERGAKVCRNHDGKTPEDWGMSDGLSSLDEHLRRKQEKAEALRCRRDDLGEIEQKNLKDMEAERAWQQKLQDELHFEHLEGWEGGVGQDTFRCDEWEWLEDEASSDGDWWEQLGKEMHARHAKYSSFFSASDQGQQKAHKPPPSSSSTPYSSSNYRDRMAWEREQAKAAHSLSQDTTMERMKRMSQHAEDWEKFLQLAKTCQQTSRRILLKDVPFPHVPPGGDIALEALMLPPHQEGDASVRKKASREALLRWHPDKFAQKFGKLIEPAEHDEIIGKVVSLSQALTQLL